MNEIKLISVLEFARYFIVAGLGYGLFYFFKKDKWLHKKIQKRFPKKEHVLYEIKYSFINLLIFSLMGIGDYWLKMNGYTKMYDHISDYGIAYFIFSIIAMILLHDTYFYWTHRFMHLKKIYPYVHQVHHHSTNPTPWAAYSFHPIEAVIDNAIITLLILVLPINIIALFIFVSYSIVLNVGGHLGYEVFPEGFTKHKLKRWSNTPTHHNMHHSYFNCNYGLYFNFWDKLMNTNHEKYHETFDKIAKAEAETP
jgi:sterol desaturase/sphingolipid hydroxylase (fatty acid hydroxylase superfamily)